jgi:hypothetical protein
VNVDVVGRVVASLVGLDALDGGRHGGWRASGGGWSVGWCEGGVTVAHEPPINTESVGQGVGVSVGVGVGSGGSISLNQKELAWPGPPVLTNRTTTQLSPRLKYGVRFCVPKAPIPCL